MPRSGWSSLAIGLTSLKVGADFQVVVKDTNQVDGFPEASNFPHFGRPRVALAAGQFLFDASHPFGRKEVVIAWRANANASTWHMNEISLRAFSLSAGGTLTRLGSSTTGVRESSTIQTFSIAAGGFQGAKATYPIASLALSIWAGSPTGQSSDYRLTTWQVTPTRVTLASGTSVKVSDGVDLRARLPLVAYLRPGNSAFLGDPVHITMLGAPETDFIMQEPPKHAYWDESKHAIVNFTRFDPNNVQLFNANTASLATSSTDHAAWSTGASI